MTLGAFRSAANVAKHAIEAVSQTATNLIGDNEAADSFASVLAGEESSKVSVGELREKLTSAIHSALAAAGIPTNPPLTIVTANDGTLSVEGDHERTVEIEGTLNDDLNIGTLAKQLATTSNPADRRLVLHNVQ